MVMLNNNMLQSTHHKQGNRFLAAKRVYQFTPDGKRTKTTFNSVRMACAKIVVTESVFNRRIKDCALLNGFYYALTETFIPKPPKAF